MLLSPYLKHFSSSKKYMKHVSAKVVYLGQKTTKMQYTITLDNTNNNCTEKKNKNRFSHQLTSLGSNIEQLLLNWKYEKFIISCHDKLCILIYVNEFYFNQNSNSQTWP